MSVLREYNPPYDTCDGSTFPVSVLREYNPPYDTCDRSTFPVSVLREYNPPYDTCDGRCSKQRLSHKMGQCLVTEGAAGQCCFRSTTKTSRPPTRRAKTVFHLVSVVTPGLHCCAIHFFPPTITMYVFNDNQSHSLGLGTLHED